MESQDMRVKYQAISARVRAKYITSVGLVFLSMVALRAAAYADTMTSSGDQSSTRPAATAVATVNGSGASDAATAKSETSGSETPATVSLASAPPNPSPTAPSIARGMLTFGGDLYMGGTNLTGVTARNNDGVWAGYNAAYPSNLAIN